MINYLPLKDITSLHGEEIEHAVNHVIRSGWYLHGEATRQFEHDYAAYIGTRHCIGCGNGYDALWLMFRAAIITGHLRPGDDVIVPANTFIASLLAVSDNGLRPVPVEPRADTLEIDDSLIEKSITPRTRAILLVHMYGRCACTDSIISLCRQRCLMLFEDNAQAHGCTFRSGYRTEHTGSIGYAAAHSFYPGKNLGALGDGGAVTTNDDKLAEVIRSLGNYGSSKKYVFPHKGRNSRLDEIQAAVLSIKLKYLDKENNRRRQIAQYYYNNITNPHVSLPGLHSNADCVFHIFPVLSGRRDELQNFLNKHGIATMIHYPIPPHRQQCYTELNMYQLPITDMISRSELSLPCNQAMTDDDVRAVTDAVNSWNGR